MFGELSDYRESMEGKAFLSFPSSLSPSEILSRIDKYLAEAGYFISEPNRASNKIYFSDRVYDGFDAAHRGLKELRIQSSFRFSVLGVRYFHSDPQMLTSKRLLKLESQYNEILKAHSEAFPQDYIVAMSANSVLAKCRHCGSRINKDYLKTNYCPVCNNDMRSEGYLKRYSVSLEKLHKLEEAMRRERIILADKEKDKYLNWLVLFEYEYYRDC